MNEVYNIRLASNAQKKFCEEHGLPLFAPSDGTCFHCCRNIYVLREVENRDASHDGPKYSGVTVEKAGAYLITGCPHCNYSYVD